MGRFGNIENWKAELARLRELAPSLDEVRASELRQLREEAIEELFALMEDEEDFSPWVGVERKGLHSSVALFAVARPEGGAQ